MASALASVILSDKLACQAPVSRFGVLRADELESAKDVQAVEDTESLSLQVTKLDSTGQIRPFVNMLKAGRILTCLYEDGSVDEWRVGTVQRGRGEKGIVTITGTALWLDTVERANSTSGAGWVSEIVAGVRQFEYELTQRTPSSILSTYVIPNLPTWITLGTVDPTTVIPSLTVSRMTPGALVLAVRDALRAVDVSCEVRLRRNGTTDYKLDLVTQVGASANVPVFHPANSLLALTERADPTLQSTRVLVKGGSDPDGDIGQWGLARWRGAAPSGNTIALTDRNGGAVPIAFDNQFVNNYLLRVKTGRTFLITASNAAAGTVTLASISTIGADEDFEFRLDEPLTNTRNVATRYAVSAVPDGTHITCGASNPITVDGQYTDWYARVWSLGAGGVIIATTRISTTVAATDILTVASSAGVNNTHFVQFIQLDGNGEVPSFVDHPTYAQPDPTGYGIKTMELTRSALGISQIGRNAWMRQWSNGANPPDGYVLTGLGPVASQNSNAAFTRYGGFSWRITNNAGTMQGPTSYPPLSLGLFNLSGRALVYYATYTAAGGTNSALEIWAVGPDGVSLVTHLGTVQVAPIGSSLGVTEVGTGAWIEMKIEGITLNPASAPYGVVARYTSNSAGTTTVDAYLDALELYPFAKCPNDPTEFGDAQSLLQSGNNQLRNYATPPRFYTFAVRDLARAFASEYPRLGITLGGNVRAADVEDGLDVTVRALKIDRDLLDSMNSVLTLANRATRITEYQSAIQGRGQRIVTFLQSDAQQVAAAGPAFVTLTSAVSLPSNVEISTPITGAPTVGLAVDTAVTYTPAIPTDPTTTITVGTPPSRQKPFPVL